MLGSEAILTTYAAYYQNFFAPNVGHGAFCYLHKHSKYRLLEGEAQVGRGDDVFGLRVIQMTETSVCCVSLC
jgi:hypothetical protein